MSKKVLLLHGLAQSGDYFASKTKGFRIFLEAEGYEFSYATAPNEFSPADMPDNLDNVTRGNPTSKVLAWIQDIPVDKSYFLPQTTVDYLRSYVIENGPFHGVIGFSQGAGVTGYLMTDFNGLLGLTAEQQPPLNFFIAISGFKFKPESYQQQYNDHPITIPSLHVQGELDTITEESKVLQLFNSCSYDSRTLLKHPGGHYVPNSKGFAKKVVDWLHKIDK